MPAPLPHNPVFDELFASAVPLVTSGEHQHDVPPADGGRWPVTVLCIPPRPVRDRLEELMRASLDHAGPGHFLTGRPDTSHLTVRALEPYREAAAPDEAVTTEWLAALERAAAATPPLRFRLTGLTLTRVSVMAQVEARDDEPWRFMRRLRHELGPLAWYEEQWMVRNIWYANVIHFAAPILDAPGLVEWVSRHRLVEPLDFTVESATLVRSRYAEGGGERYMAMERWFEVPFASSPH